MSFSPDGTRFAAGDEDGTVHLWTDAGEHLASKKLFAGSSNILAWAPGGDALAMSGWYTDSLYVARIAAATISPEFEYRGHLSSVNQIAWSPDGTRLASGGWEDPHLVLHTRTGEEFTSRKLEGLVEETLDLRWAPNGAMLAATTGDEFRGRVHLWNAAGTARQPLLMRESAEPNFVSSIFGPDLTVAWSPTGNSLVSANQTAVFAWSADASWATVKPVARWSQRQEAIDTEVLGWTATDRIVTYSSDDNTIRVWRTGVGEPLTELTVTMLDLVMQ
jgi:WD40 repeat protein